MLLTRIAYRFDRLRGVLDLARDFFPGQTPSRQALRDRGQRRRSDANAPSVAVQPAGFTLRSSSRSAMAEVKVENKGRENLLFVLQAMHLDSEDVYDMPARHGQEGGPQGWVTPGFSIQGSLQTRLHGLLEG